jgi:hypothetical protein
MVKKHNYVRRNYMVDKPFQMKFTGVIVLVQVCAAVLAAFGVSCLYLFVFNTGKVVCRVDYWIFIQWTIIVTFVCLALIIWAIVYTHRISGPIKRARLLLRAAASGDIPDGTIKFRKNDYFKGLDRDLAACFEAMKKYRDGGTPLS